MLARWIRQKCRFLFYSDSNIHILHAAVIVTCADVIQERKETIPRTVKIIQMRFLPIRVTEYLMDEICQVVCKQ